jgi:hypothetical protein
MFTNGQRCRRRATPSAAWAGTWCEKHGPVIKVHDDNLKGVLAEMAAEDESDAADNQEED